jgi:hypothetical protein
VGQFNAAVVSSGASLNSDSAQRELDQRIRQACHEAAIHYQQEFHLQGPFVSITPEIVAGAKEDFYQETVSTTQGPAIVAHQLLVFDDEFAAGVRKTFRHAEIGKRLGVTGFLSGITVAAVSVMYGLFSFRLRRLERKQGPSGEPW